MTDVPILGVITASTRPGRVGPAFAQWFAQAAAAQGSFKVTTIDLADMNLPVFDEPNFPILQGYQHPHTIAWSKKVSQLDAVVFVTPEYNHGPPPSAINALSFLSREWAYMPIAFVGYGGLAGGARAIQTLRLIAMALRMAPVPESVLFPNCQQCLGEAGEVNASQGNNEAAGVVLRELRRWADALANLRASVVARSSG